MKFQFMTAAHIIFGPGAGRESIDMLLALGDRPFIVTGSSKEGVDEFIEGICNIASNPVFFRVSGEPSVPLINRALGKARDNACNAVIAVGGGSVIDTGKAVSALLTNGDNCLDFLEVVGKGKPLHTPPVPFAALPTTAGTGSEVTKNAVIISPEHNVKVSMRSEMMIPTYAVVDPELCLSMPPDVTAWTGLDALTQLLEAYVTRRRNPLTDGLCREGITRAARSLVRACTDGSDLEARTDMSCAGLFGGIVLANAGLGAVHGFAGPLGGMFNISHGLICASLLPHVFAVNCEALAREESSDLEQRFSEIPVLLTGLPDPDLQHAITWMTNTCRSLGIPRLSDFGIKHREFPDIVRKAMQSSSMKGNPVRLSVTLGETLID